jgi:branched-chain amino acid transport system substrate-binding protein
LSFKDAAALWDDVKSDPRFGALQAALAYKLAKIYYHVRDFKRSEDMLRLVTTKYGDSSFGPPARDFLARLTARFIVDGRTIGVILPLTGKYEQYGQRSLAAIKLALRPDPTIRLVVKDTQGDPAVVSQAVEDLVLLDHVIAIIGPLFSNEALSAAQKAEELSVPLLTLSFREGLPEIGPFVFRTALTVETQAKELARVAFEELGFSRFALLYPRNSYGLEFVNAFWDEVDRRKGEIRGAESYDNDQTTFTEPVRRLVGRWYLNNRQDFKDALAQLKRRKLAPTQMQNAVEKLQKRLPPIVDFDAVVIPDSSEKIGLIAPALAVEDLVTTRDPKELEKIEKATGNPNIHPVTLLGASTWNSPQTLESCERYCEGAVFVDAFFPDSPDPKVRDFVAAFHDATGAAPHLGEAQAFDTAGLLRTILNTKKPADRTTLRDELAHFGTYEGVTGRLYFDGSGEPKKELFVLTIQDGAIRRWVRVAAAPQG